MGRHPGHDYAGRYAELGGLTRDEQEKAMREVQEEAERRQNDRYPLVKETRFGKV